MIRPVDDPWHATGGLAENIIPFSRTIQHHEPWLTIQGLRIIKAFNLENEMRRRVGDSIDDVEQAANKLARVVWAVLARGRPYQPRIITNVA